MKALVVSSANMDFDFYVSRVPQPGETVTEQGSYTLVPGGKGSNAATAFARLGAETFFCTCLGRDPNGRALLAGYEACGIDTRFIAATDDAPTGAAAIYIEQNGTNRISVYPGANHCLTDAHIDAALENGADAVLLQLELKSHAILHAAQGAAQRGIPVVLDAGPASPAFPLDALPPLAVFSPNETETETFSGIFPGDDASCEAACRALSQRVASRYFVLKLGGRGAYLFDGESGMRFPAYDTAVVDTTAAGDAFTAALTASLFDGNSIETALHYANAVGALTVGRRGAADSIPQRAEVAQFCAAHGILL